jgi:hypothetical protein
VVWPNTGDTICVRLTPATSDRRFGLFHYKGETAVKVRNVVLRGNWPLSLTAAEQNDLFAPAKAVSAQKIARAEQALVSEAILTTAAYDVWKASQEMAPADRYEYLKAWVLPSESHGTVRLQIDWTPSDAFDPAVAPDDGQRAHMDGQLVAPALELAALAKATGKLSELATAAAAAAKEYPDQARPLAAFGVLLALARGDDQAAIAGLKQAIETIKKQPAQTPPHERHAEYLAAYTALANPAARPAAKALALEIANDQRPPRNVDPTWARRVVRLRSMANWRADQKTAQLPFGQSAPLKDWQPVTRSTAQERGEGYPAGAWKLLPGEATCLSGSPRAALYYAVPLTGDFEARGQISTAANRTVRLVYGGFALAVGAEGKQLIRQEIGRSTDTRTPLLEKPAKWGPTVEYKLAVKDGLLTASINGQQVHSERLPAKADPWLAIETTTPNQTGTLKDLRITGSPNVPKDIDLCWGPALEGWRADYYGEQAGISPNRGAAAPQWTREQNEIRATRLAKTAGSFRESVLQYHRPLLEDGQVEYEFFSEPGKTEVHPVLDRLAFLLSPDGVKLHRLTDAQYDRGSQKPDNAQPLPGSRPVPLKAGGWNRLKLTVRGDTVTVEVNGSEVATHAIEPLNDRTFGLFRYADAAGVRVRNVVHRGDWPAALPPLAEQSLATADGKPGK